MQLKIWTEGELYQTKRHAADPERFYSSVSTDTRSLLEGEVFVPLVGDHFDGHDFLEAAAQKGAAMLVIEAHAKKLSQWLKKIGRASCRERV